MCIYTTEMPVESEDVFHRGAANGLCEGSVLLHRLVLPKSCVY